MPRKEIALANKIITSQYRLNDIECRLVFHLIGRIKREDKNFVEYKYTMKELLQAVGMTANNVKQLEAVMDSLFTKIIKIDENFDGETKWTKYHWFDTVTHILEEKTYTIRFNEALKPYLLRLTEDFSLLDFQCIMALPIHSRRIYMLAKKDVWQNTSKQISIAELMESLELGKGYKRFQNLKDRILIPAEKEINEISDIILTIKPDETTRRGKAYRHLIFTARRKPKPKEISTTPPETAAAKPKSKKSDYDIQQERMKKRNIVGEKLDALLAKRWAGLSDNERADYLLTADAIARGYELLGAMRGDIDLLARGELGKDLEKTDKEYSALAARYETLGKG